MNETKHTEKLPEPVFASRVLRARLLAEAAGLKFGR
jgi:hypothetical protein